MNCTGIYMDQHTHSALFNPKLAIEEGNRVILGAGPNPDPEWLRIKVEGRVKRAAPHIVMKFRDAYTELLVDEPKGDYVLMICMDAPMYSGRAH